MRMPAVIVGHHRDTDVTNLGLARQLRFLQIGHANHVHAQAAIYIRLRLRGKLRAFHAEIGSAAFPDHARLDASRLDHSGKFRTNGIGESNVRDNAAAEERIYAMAGTVEKLIGDDKLHRLVLLFERPNRRNGDNALDTELLEGVNVGAKIQLARQDSMAASMPRQKCHLAPLEHAADKGVGSRAEWSFYPHLLCFAQAGHGIQPASPDDADFGLRQNVPLKS